MIGGFHGCDTVAPGLGSPEAEHAGDKEYTAFSRYWCIFYCFYLFPPLFPVVLARLLGNLLGTRLVTWTGYMYNKCRLDNQYKLTSTD